MKEVFVLEEQKDVLIKVLGIISSATAIVPIINGIVQLIFTNTNTYKENLINFLEKVLIPIIQELRGKTLKEIDKTIMDKIVNIHEKHIVLIPRYMDMRYTQLKKQFIDGKIDKTTYYNYYNYVYLTFWKVRKKLGYPRSSNLIYYKTSNPFEMIFWGLIYPLYIGTCTFFLLKEYTFLLAISIVIFSIMTVVLLSADDWLISRRLKRHKVKSNQEESHQQKLE